MAMPAFLLDFCRSFEEITSRHHMSAEAPSISLSPIETRPSPSAPPLTISTTTQRSWRSANRQHCEETSTACIRQCVVKSSLLLR